MHEAGDFLGVGEHSGGADRHLDTDAYALRELRLNKAARLERASVLPTSPAYFGKKRLGSDPEKLIGIPCGGSFSLERRPVFWPPDWRTTVGDSWSASGFTKRINFRPERGDIEPQSFASEHGIDRAVGDSHRVSVASVHPELEHLDAPKLGIDHPVPLDPEGRTRRASPLDRAALRAATRRRLRWRWSAEPR